MATKRILKLTNTEAIIKIDGSIGTVTIDLDVDLVGANEVAPVGSVPTVNIVSMFATGDTSGLVTITRNGEVLYNLSTNTVAKVDLQDLGGLTDPTNNTYDIDVTTSGADCQLIIKLRKISGYKTKIQTEQYSVYDDPDVLLPVED